MLHSSLVEKCPHGGGMGGGGGVCACRISVETPQVFLPSPRRHPPERRAWGIPGAVLGPAAPFGGDAEVVVEFGDGRVDAFVGLALGWGHTVGIRDPFWRGEVDSVRSWDRVALRNMMAVLHSVRAVP